jgi:hypothetical protein
MIQNWSSYFTCSTRFLRIAIGNEKVAQKNNQVERNPPFIIFKNN